MEAHRKQLAGNTAQMNKHTNTSTPMQTLGVAKHMRMQTAPTNLKTGRDGLHAHVFGPHESLKKLRNAYNMKEVAMEERKKTNRKTKTG